MLYRDYSYGAAGYESSYVQSNGNSMILYTHRQATLLVDEEGWVYRVGCLERDLTTQIRHAIKLFMDEFDLGSYQMGIDIFEHKIKYNIYTGEVV